MAFLAKRVLERLDKKFDEYAARIVPRPYRAGEPVGRGHVVFHLCDDAPCLADRRLVMVLATAGDQALVRMLGEDSTKNPGRSEHSDYIVDLETLSSPP